MRKYLEQIIRVNSDWPEDVPLWEEFMADKKTKQNLALYGNIGMSSLAYCLALIGMFVIGELPLYINIVFTVVLTLFLYFGIRATLAPFKFSLDEA